MSRVLDALAGVVRSAPAVDQRLVVANRTQPEPVQRLLEAAFEGQSVEVGDVELLGATDDIVLLLRDEEVVASSPLSELMDSYLLINSDRYLTGGVDLDRFEPPAVIAGLDETVFEVRGYPVTSKGKFVLIVMSRYIEARALRRGVGTLRATFQDLSRIDDEVGTHDVYRGLAEADVDVHVYGTPSEAPDGLDVTPHVGSHDGYRKSWGVVFTPPPGGTGHAALVAIEEASNTWLGTWTYRPESVERVDAILADDF